MVDKGFEGAENHRRWLDNYGARLNLPRPTQRPRGMAQALEALVAGIRQIVESVYDKLFNARSVGGSGPTS